MSTLAYSLAPCTRLLVVVGLLSLGACHEEIASSDPRFPGVVEKFPPPYDLAPGVRVDRAARVIELAGTVPIDCHDPQTPRIYLEVLACPRDTKEHEALVMLQARPSDVHAALLLIGLEPGSPGFVGYRERELVRVAPTGPRVRVEFRTDDGTAHDPRTWIVNARTGESLTPHDPEGSWVFSGSKFLTRSSATGERAERYAADAQGTAIGLHTFGDETLAYTSVMSPDSQLLAPEWIADPQRVPAYGSRVRVILTPGSQKP